MHVLQWIAVQADDKDEAYRRVEDNLQTMLGEYESATNTWFDWFVVGGGRWNMSEEDDHTQAYVEGKTNLIVSAKDEPDLFKERTDETMQSRQEEFDRYAKDVDSTSIDRIIKEYNPRDFDFFSFRGIYPIKKIIDMAYGTWDFNSYFFDMVNDTVVPKYMVEAIDKDPENWYLVPVDFHF
jgi:hypothetical protein